VFADSDAKAGATPLGKPVLQPAGADPVLGQQSHGVVGEHAERPATVRDNVDVLRQATREPLEVLRVDAAGTW